MAKTTLIIRQNEFKFPSLVRLLNGINILEDKILECRSVEEALKQESSGISIILAGITLTPIRSGSPIKQLRRHYTGVPIIVLVETDSTENIIYAISQGAEEVLIDEQFDNAKLDTAITIAKERKALCMRFTSILADYKNHFENGPMPMWIIDERTMRFMLVNNAAVEKYGYSKAEFSGMSIMDIRPKEDIPKTLESYHHRKGTPYFDAGYWKHRKKNGELFHVHVYSHQTRFENTDARLCFVVDVNDKIIADQRNNELMTLMAAQKQQLDGIMDAIDQAIWSRDAETHVLLYGNRAYYALYGFEPGDPLFDNKFDLNTIHPEDRAIFLQAINDVKTYGKVDYTYRYVNKDSNVKILKGKAVYKKGIDGKPDTIDGITTDITVEKALYDTIRNSEQKLLTTINNTHDLIWSVDRDLKIIYCNKAYQDFFRKWFNISLDEGDYVLGNWHSPEFIIRRKNDYARALSGEVFTTVVEEHFNGGTQYFEINSSPIVDIDEKIVGVNCVSRDITSAEMQLKKINEQNERLKEIAWIQSHKVRGPVASIMGLIPLFDNKKAGDDHNLDVLEKIYTAATELDAVIKEIVSKSEAIN